MRLGWQRRPARVAVAVAPGYPRGTPLRIRDPDPALSRESDPATVMIGRPPVWLVGVPSPTGIRINPFANGVRAPLRGDIPWLPAVAVVSHFDPVPVGFQ